MKFKKISTVSETDLFVEQIQKAILSGQLKPGERLPSERTLQKEMGISRSVINNGLQRLARQRLVKIKPRSGNFVADFAQDGNLTTLNIILHFKHGKYDRQLLSSIFAVRLNIEKDIIRLAAKNGDHSTNKQAKYILNRFRNETDPEKQGQLIADFFHQLSINSKNTVYPLLMNNFAPLYVILTEGLCQAGKADKIYQYNLQLLTTIEQHSAEKAINQDKKLIKWCYEQLMLFSKAD